MFDELEQRQWTGDRLVVVGLNPDTTSIVGVTVQFAYFVDPEDDDGDEPVITDERVEAGWSALPDGTRADFDEVWRTAVGTAEGRLGPPEATGMHDTEWHHAIWRAGDTLISLVQGGTSTRTATGTRPRCGWCLTRRANRYSPAPNCTT